MHTRVSLKNVFNKRKHKPTNPVRKDSHHLKIFKTAAMAYYANHDVFPKIFSHYLATDELWT